MKSKGSLIGPLIVILIGVVFLMKNLRPELPLFEWLVNWWPFLLIGWGAIRFVEILFNYMQGRALPRAGVSGGEWTLIVFLTLFGSAIWGVRHYTKDGFGRIKIGGVEVFGENFEYPVVAGPVTGVEKNARIVINNPRGNTRVVGADVAEVRVTGRKSIRAMDKSSADKASERAAVQLNKAGQSVTITASDSPDEGSQRISMDLEITVPRGASIEARGRYGDFDISDVAGEVRINSDNAGVRLQNIGGKVDVETRRSDIIRAVDVKGNVTLKGRGRDIDLEKIAGQVEINGSYSGETRLRELAKPVRFESSITEIRMERVPGEVQLTLSALTGSNLIGPVFVRTKSKDIRLTDFTESVTIDVDSGDVELRQSKLPVAKMNVSVRSGDIELALPQNAKFAIEAKTRRGEVNNDFDDRLKIVAEDRGGRITGALGGGPEIKLATERGTLSVRKMVAELSEAEPEKPPAKGTKVAPPERAIDQ
jgi:DUF4097 and DUF4098 domain-containing protein YvlB